MIYIISEENDLITDLVVEWLIDGNVDFKRINDKGFEDVVFTLKNMSIFQNAKKIWQRRGKANYLPKQLFSNYPNRKSFLDYLSKEESILTVYIENELRNKLNQNYIGSFISEATNNKLINLKIAKQNGFNVPETLVTTNKKELQFFLKRHKKIITKDLRAPVNIKTAKKSYFSTGVKLVEDSMIKKLNEYFAPAFFQAYIPKEYEIRVFIFSDQLYSMAIFSQNDIQTSIDFRNYNRQKPNRTVPVILPNDIKDSVLKFMKASNLNTGSIDLIVTPDNEYYFLEVNPMGQFHWLSMNCNYYVDKHIANLLSDEKN